MTSGFVDTARPWPDCGRRAPSPGELAWAQVLETRRSLPATMVPGQALPGFVPDIDATIVAAHSEKESAAATWKHTFGYHPLTTGTTAHPRPGTRNQPGPRPGGTACPNPQRQRQTRRDQTPGRPSRLMKDGG
ncbi:hypothetical protein Aau02nite_27620 [Amorphoplanes auranticolor]|uniref:Uncharacterized protein n=1 Tax=Actinoplanes auranticolor TaxID=47988 RepID=A0A919SBN5_9ACTN|nr:hypothetical protein [Actinoplanes auranticolor]GIM67518.1 hypothetical protein Aau02nite_27620 [Actinoplanes auranticolor]